MITKSIDFQPDFASAENRPNRFWSIFQPPSARLNSRAAPQGNGFAPAADSSFYSNDCYQLGVSLRLRFGGQSPPRGLAEKRRLKAPLFGEEKSRHKARFFGKFCRLTAAKFQYFFLESRDSHSSKSRMRDFDSCSPARLEEKRIAGKRAGEARQGAALQRGVRRRNASSRFKVAKRLVTSQMNQFRDHETDDSRQIRQFRGHETAMASPVLFVVTNRACRSCFVL